MRGFLYSLSLVIALSTSMAHSAVTVSVNGSNHTIPQTNEKGWGANVTAWIQAISQFTLQNSGGTFTLTADANFGASYGLVSSYYKSRSSNIASAGVLRLANTDTIAFRNAANDGNILLAIDGSNNLTFNGVAVPTATLANVQDSTFYIYDNGDATKRIAFQASGITTATTRTVTVPDSNVDLGALVNANISGSAAVAYSKLNLTDSIVNADINSAAAIADSKLATISTALKVSNSATTATDANTNSAIVARDGSGNFSAGTITANLTGAVTGNASTATALASNPSDCASDTYATAIAASGNLTCGAVSAAGGGTGQTSYTIGDLLYASGATALSKLAAGTSGYVLTSGGAGVAPSWVSGLTNPMNAGGQIIYGGASGAPTALANGSAGQFLASAGGTSAPAWTSFPRSEVYVDSCNGHGSTATKVRRFNVTPKKATGTAITYADNATNGGSFTINEAGVYTIHYSDYRTGGTMCIAVSVNASSLTTNACTLTYANGRRLGTNQTVAGTATMMSWTGILAASDVVRAHTDGNGNSTDEFCALSITQVSK